MIFLFLAAFAISAYADGIHLHGVLRDSVSSLPIADAHIQIIGTRIGTQSAADGRFDLSGIEPGQYSVGIRRLGYYDRVVTVRVSRDTTIAIALIPLSIELRNVVIESKRPLAHGTEHDVQLDGQYLDRHRGQTFGELITNVPGISLLQTGTAIAKPVIRGLHSERVVISSGGIQHRAQEWGLDHGPAVDPFLPSSIAVIRGAASIEDSYAAIGGVIRIEPPLLHYHRAFEGRVSLLGSTNNGMGAAGFQIHGSDLGLSNTAYLLHASGMIAGDSRTPQYVLSNTGARSGSCYVAVGYDAGNWRHELSYSLFDAAIGILAASHLGNADDLRRAIDAGQPLIIRPWSYSITNPRQEIVHQTLYVHSTHSTDDGTLELHYGWQRNDRSEYDAHAMRYSDTTLIQQAINRPAIELSLASYQLELRYRFADRDASNVMGIHFLRQSNIRSGQVFLLPDYVLYEGGILGTRTFSLGRWLASVGLRGDLQWVRARPYNKSLGRYDPDTTMIFGGVAAHAGLERSLDNSLHLQLNIATHWRPPAPVELFAGDLHHGTAVYEVGDRTLGVERAYSFDAAVTTPVGRWQLNITTYGQYLPRFIQLLPDSMPTVTYRGVFPTMRYSQRRAVVFGGEVSASIPLWTAFRLDAQLAIVRGLELPSGAFLAFMPADRARLAVHYHFDESTSKQSPYVELSVTLVRRQTAVSSTIFDYAPPPAGYGTVDVIAGGQWSVMNIPLQFSLRIQNLFDTPFRDYLSRYRYFALNPGRNVTIAVTIPFGMFNNSLEALL